MFNVCLGFFDVEQLKGLITTELKYTKHALENAQTVTKKYIVFEPYIQVLSRILSDPRKLVACTRSLNKDPDP